MFFLGCCNIVCMRFLCWTSSSSSSVIYIYIYISSFQKRKEK